MFQHNPVLERWEFDSAMTMSTTVLPDGCRDVIGRLEPGGRTTCWLTDWVDTAYTVHGQPGQTWVGYRLQPGVCLQEGELKRQIELMGDAPLDTDLRNLLADHACVDDDVVSALQALAQVPRVALAARALGVSERSLLRTVQRQTGKVPSYWLQLARARRAARDLRTDTPLAELAARHGYSDQAHLSRSMRQWFGYSPQQLRRLPDYLSGIKMDGYC
jgi:AraC-like DNA-binding protein